MVICHTQNIRKEGKPCSPYTLDSKATPKTEITTDRQQGNSREEDLEKRMGVGSILLYQGNGQKCKRGLTVPSESWLAAPTVLLLFYLRSVLHVVASSLVWKGRFWIRKLIQRRHIQAF